MAVTAGEPNASKSKPTFQPDELLNRWNLMSDIYVMGLRCDIFRFGNLQLFASSDRIFMRGDYNGMPGKTIKFTHGADHHDAWYHKPEESKPGNDEMLGFLHILSRCLVHTVQSLDDPMYPGSNGKSFFQNHLVLLGCEMGAHGDNGTKTHNMPQCFHFVSSAGGKIKTGLWDSTKKDVCGSLYATCLRALDVKDPTGLGAGKGMDYLLM